MRRLQVEVRLRPGIHVFSQKGDWIMKRVFALLSLAVVLGAAALAQTAKTAKNADCPGCDKCPLCPDGCCPGK